MPAQGPAHGPGVTHPAGSSRVVELDAEQPPDLEHAQQIAGHASPKDDGVLRSRRRTR